MGKYFTRERVGYMFGVLTRPLHSFYEIRHRDQGSVPLAALCVFLLSAAFTLNRIFAGFIVNDVNPRTVDGLEEMGAIFLILGLFCVGNWSVTCLMDGEGRLRDIVTVTGYAMLPAALLLGPATLLSLVIAEGETAFYAIVMGAGIAWTVILLLTGVMTVHNYTLLKTLVTLGLTFVAMLILVFIGLLILDLINQAYVFLYSIYTELIFRI
ncbi:MAG: YIP1 family protein [Oscillospiraceae bacterium]|nr:YIP1 family protein [Oscillospiraceae bacterium]